MQKREKHLGRLLIGKLLADNFPRETFQDAPTDYPQSRAALQVFLLPIRVFRGRGEADRRQDASPKEWAADLFGLRAEKSWLRSAHGAALRVRAVVEPAGVFELWAASGAVSALRREG
jgi:hypothetical protein